MRYPHIQITPDPISLLKYELLNQITDQKVSVEYRGGRDFYYQCYGKCDRETAAANLDVLEPYLVGIECGMLVCAVQVQARRDEQNQPPSRAKSQHDSESPTILQFPRLRKAE